MIRKSEFNELVANTTSYLTAHAQQISELEKQIQELEARLAHIEQRKKPGPKPKNQEAA